MLRALPYHHMILFLEWSGIVDIFFQTMCLPGIVTNRLALSSIKYFTHCQVCINFTNPYTYHFFLLPGCWSLSIVMWCEVFWSRCGKAREFVLRFKSADVLGREVMNEKLAYLLIYLSLMYSSQIFHGTCSEFTHFMDLRLNTSNFELK